MENKYYTPKIEEFHVGFEYEWFDVLDIPRGKPTMGNWGWRKMIADQDWIKSTVDMYHQHPEAFPNYYRVKYLDQQDIEELGWLYKNTNGMRLFFSGDRNSWFNKDIPSTPSGRYYYFQLIFDPELHTIKIMADTNYTSEEVFFEGICNNKSELKKLMQQLGI